jgi:hypothetical protein
MSFIDEAIPGIGETVVPPVVCGIADLTHRAYAGQNQAALQARIEQNRAANPPDRQHAAQCYDASIARQLAFRPAEGRDLLDTALTASRLFRIAGTTAARTNPPLRLLALMAPGDLMTNIPLDFLTRHLNIRLDLLYVLPGRPLPPVLPDHDVAFFAIGEADAPMLARLHRLYAAWPRPALNDPAFLPVLERETLSRSLAGLPGLCSPVARTITAAALRAHLQRMPAPEADGFAPAYPCLIRPQGSHAGAGLVRADAPAELETYLRNATAPAFTVTAFQDYAGADGMFRKLRVAFIDRSPFLCHMAVSGHWMVHYLNAGMTESAGKRAEEARAMAEFDHGFARRHAAAFNLLHQRLGFDYYSIDCAETPDGRLLVFEADTAAIIHLMDPAALFPYKVPQMRRVFAAFEAMLCRAVAHVPRADRSGIGQD